MEIRTLRADEIDCRIGTIKDDGSGLSLLLYKDARCDMNILDETFGAMNWKRRHCRENANCIVSIWDSDKKEWIEKEDTGTESNTEAEKGLASDSFKRACVNIGIGRELYTAPFIWISAADCKIKPKTNGRGYACYDRFEVTDIGYDSGRNIKRLIIANKNTGKIVFTMSKGSVPPSASQNSPAHETKPAGDLKMRCECCGGVLVPYPGADGKEVSIRKHAEGSKAKFNGHVYCIVCIQSGRVAPGV